MSDALVDAASEEINTTLAKLKTNLKALSPTPTPTTTGYLYDDFKYIESLAIGAKSKNGKWLLDFTSGGFAKMDGNSLVMSPAPGELTIMQGSVQVRSTTQFGNIEFDLDMTTDKQVATNKQQWMCAWLLFRHVDKWRHYYLYVGLDHMEFGRKDAPVGTQPQSEIEKYQDIIWNGGPKTPVGTKRHIGVIAIEDNFKIYCDGVKVMDLNSVSSFKAGSISPYSEGAQSRYQMLRVTPK